MRRELVSGVLGLAVVLGSAGCAAAGDAHGDEPARRRARAPTPSEVAEHPCRYGDVPACVARCDGSDLDGVQRGRRDVRVRRGMSSDPALASGFYSRACNGNYGPGLQQPRVALPARLGRARATSRTRCSSSWPPSTRRGSRACAATRAGCLLAGELLYEGRVGEDGAALAFFRRACDGGDAHGCARAVSLR